LQDGQTSQEIAMKPFLSLIRRVLPQGWNRYLLVALVLWLLALVATQAPLFLTAPEPSASDYHLVDELTASMLVATVLLGFAIGWTRRASSIVRCALYGAFVLTTTQFLLTHWVPEGGEPIFPMPVNFLIAMVFSGIPIGLLLGLGALAAMGAHRWLRPRPAHRPSESTHA
jgi:hypothetical protein